MRVLLSTYGSRGDVEPVAALAAQLQALGADAIVCAPEDEEFVALLARACVAQAPAFMPVRDWIATAKQSGARLPQLAARMIAAQYAAIDAAADGCDAIVATGLFPSVAAAQCVAEKRGIAYRFAAFCPLLLPSHHHQPFPYPGHPHPPDVTEPRALWDFNVKAKNALFGEAVNAHRSSIGLRPVDNVCDYIFTDRPLLASDVTLSPWRSTDLCDPVQTGAWILPDDRPLPNKLLAFLEAGAPPVYVGFGSIALPSAKGAAHTAIAAVRAAGYRALVLRGWADVTLDDDDGCFVTGDINQQALFARVAAVIHHGGAGTATIAARAGAPQLIVPQFVDQPYWGGQVSGLGIGVAHDGPTPTYESLSAALKIVLAPDTRTRAAQIARMIRADGATAAAKWLLIDLARCSVE